MIYLIGDFNDWTEKPDFALKRKENGVWEITLTKNQIVNANLYKLRSHWSGGKGDRIPAYARRVVQDPKAQVFNAQVWLPPNPYVWKKPVFTNSKKPPLIYEAHVGMAQDGERIGTYKEFTTNVIPRIVKAGYNTLQLMAIQEHPYYG